MYILERFGVVERRREERKEAFLLISFPFDFILFPFDFIFYFIDMFLILWFFVFLFSCPVTSFLFIPFFLFFSFPFPLFFCDLSSIESEQAWW